MSHLLGWKPRKEDREKEAKEIEDFINKARDELNKEVGCEILPYKAKVIFIKE